ncbi:hypothetical protein ACI68E_002395 [Malassezia pachydermatis]
MVWHEEPELDTPNLAGVGTTRIPGSGRNSPHIGMLGITSDFGPGGGQPFPRFLMPNDGPSLVNHARLSSGPFPRFIRETEAPRRNAVFTPTPIVIKTSPTQTTIQKVRKRVHSPQQRALATSPSPSDPRRGFSSSSPVSLQSLPRNNSSMDNVTSPLTNSGTLLRSPISTKTPNLSPDLYPYSMTPLRKDSSGSLSLHSMANPDDHFPRSPQESLKYDADRSYLSSPNLSRADVTYASFAKSSTSLSNFPSSNADEEAKGETSVWPTPQEDRPTMPTYRQSGLDALDLAFWHSQGLYSDDEGDEDKSINTGHSAHHEPKSSHLIPSLPTTLVNDDQESALKNTDVLNHNSALDADDTTYDVIDDYLNLHV